jgi:hypothetical protein
MLAELRSVRYPVETALLVALALFLPLFEAPKNLAWLAYVLTWVWNRARARDFGGRWDLWDTLIAAWIASGYLVAAFAGLHDQEWTGANDLARYATVLWLVKRGGYSEPELRWVLGALVASALAALAWGWWKVWIALEAGRRGQLQLKSVGHVNHSAIYLAMVFGVCAAWLFARWRAWDARRRVYAAAATAFVLLSLLVMASRGALAAAAALVLVLGAAWWPRSRAPLVAGLAVLALAGAAAFGLDSGIARKQQVFAAAGNPLSSRDAIWRLGTAAWERHPWFGVGMSNYDRISLERVAEWRARAGKDFDRTRYAPNAHAHNLFVNALAERGLVGGAALVAVLAAWLAWLVRLRPRAADDDARWLLWGGAASAWVVTVGAGMVNTTLHHEHGILATLLLGAWLANLAHRGS